MPNLLVLTAVIFLCGLTIAPTLIAGYSLLESTARPGRATEAMSWLSTGISVGRGLRLDGGRVHPRRARPALGLRRSRPPAGVTASALIYLAGLRRGMPRSS